ncbi:MAG: YbgC/FadM family acyl-CoA thioesterase [Campylobacterales bacterium]|nr:YbgC/FadM family acyl-CoA thioesterase [Campylobacterales bacterium]
MKIRVYYEDTDAGGIVYHTNYIKYCERARSEHFFSRNMMPGEGDRYGFVVRKIHADFLGSAVLGDMLEVKTSIIDATKSSITLLQEISRADQKLFSMEVLLVYIEVGKPRRIPEHLLNILQELNDHAPGYPS